MANYLNQGSMWNKWDLHVHSPKTFLNNNFGDCSIDNFVNKICDTGIKVVGLTNYFRFDTADFDIKDKLKKKGVTVFLNLEIRLSYQNNNNDCCDIHIIFDDSVTKNDIDNFLTILSVNVNGNAKIAKSLIPKDFKIATIEFDHLTETLHKESLCLADKYLMGFMSRGKGNSRTSTNYAKIAKNSHFLIHSSDSLLNVVVDRAYWLRENKPLLQSSDAHDLEGIGNKFTWIKADQTFEGLKQIIYEPEDRVYIGTEPPILYKVRNNNTKYIKSLEINHNSNHTGDTWFKNISILFNKELVAIIGNKGSGKSGIADILGLVGDTHIDKKHFSFLHKNKFLKNKLADKFKATIVWEGGGQSQEMQLSSDLNTEKQESVRFIPQNYFEELTNEIEISKFQGVLEKIIFEYIPSEEKLGQSNFEELKKYKTDNVNEIIQTQKNQIQDINNEIIGLEKKKHPSYLEKINGSIEQKEIEVKAQQDLLEALPNIRNPNDRNNEEKQQNNLIEQHNTDLKGLNETLDNKKIEKSNIIIRIASLEKFKEKIEQQKQTLDNFLKENLEEARKYNLNIRDILKVETNYSSINKLVNDAKTELTDINVYFESIDSIEENRTQNTNKSIVYEIEKLSKIIKTEIDKLTGENKVFQENERKKNVINKKIKELIGTSEKPKIETLEYYKKEKKFITDDLPKILQDKRNDRITKSLEIFNKKNEIIDLYDSFKESVDTKITDNEDLLKDYDIKIDSSFNLNSYFYQEFLGYIHQGKRGCFYGAEEGKNKIKDVVEDSGFNDEGNIKSLLENIIINLEENNKIISDQINEGKLNKFYNYVFSLDYINPEYELKLGEKSLIQLSPGERGALLLIFYLMIDKQEIPLIIDQPEDNLDNESVYIMLSKFIKQAKKKRQIIMVTHNPNLAVCADAEQIIHVSIDKINKNKFSFISGSIENPEINQKIIQILEGTKPAFDKRKLKYQAR